MIEVECDPDKRARTLRERGLDMLRANEVLEGVTVTFEDHRRDYGEPRFLSLGYLDDRMVIIAWTSRYRSSGQHVHRIISMRKANDREQKRYGYKFIPRRH